MTITEICDMLRKELFNTGYEYGFIADGVKYTPDMTNGFDEQYYQKMLTIYRVQETSVTKKEKVGTCVDTILVMQELLQKQGVPCKLWLQYNKEKNKVHTIITFEAEGKLVYLELTPQSSKPWYGKELVYTGEQEFFEEFAKKNYELSDITNALVVGQQPEPLLAKLSMPVSYKRLTKYELDTFIELRIRQLREEGATEEIDLKPALFDYYNRHMADGTFVSWLAMDGDRIVGTSGMSFVEKPPYFGCTSGKIGLLSSMYTIDEYRRKGIAKELLARVVEEARQYGCGAVQITASDMGVLLYTDFGFVKNGNFMQYKL